MVILTIGVSLFAIAFLAHVIIWRTCLPQRQIFVLTLVFILTAIAVVLLGVLVNGLILQISSMKIMLIALFYFSLAFDYVILFSAIEADSPTLTMIALIQQRGSEGMKREDLVTLMALQDFPNIRLEQMLSDGMVILQDGFLSPGKSGHLLSYAVFFYRRLIGRDSVVGKPQGGEKR